MRNQNRAGEEMGKCLCARAQIPDCAAIIPFGHDISYLFHAKATHSNAYPYPLNHKYFLVCAIRAPKEINPTFAQCNRSSPSFTVWRWDAEDDLTDAERVHFNLPPKADTASAAALGAATGTEDGSNDADIDLNLYQQMATNDDVGMSADDYGSAAGPGGASYAGAPSASRKQTKYDPNRLANGKRRLNYKDNRYRGLPGEKSCNAMTTRGKPCQNCAAANSTYCHMHEAQLGIVPADDAGDAAGADASGARCTPVLAKYAPGDGPLVKSKRFTGIPGEKPCRAYTTRGKPCGFAAMEKADYCPTHKRTFDEVQRGNISQIHPATLAAFRKTQMAVAASPGSFGATFSEGNQVNAALAAGAAALMSGGGIPSVAAVPAASNSFSKQEVEAPEQRQQEQSITPPQAPETSGVSGDPFIW